MSLPGPYLLALGAWELLDNARINILERLGLARCPPGQRDLRGQVFLVTGGNAGVGKATVHDLASRGAHVIIAARSVARGNAAMQVLHHPATKKNLPMFTNFGQPSIHTKLTVTCHFRRSRIPAMQQGCLHLSRSCSSTSATWTMYTEWHNSLGAGSNPAALHVCMNAPHV